MGVNEEKRIGRGFQRRRRWLFPSLEGQLPRGEDRAGSANNARKARKRDSLLPRERGWSGADGRPGATAAFRAAPMAGPRSSEAFWEEESSGVAVSRDCRKRLKQNC